MSGLMRFVGQNLFSCEACYLSLCRVSFTACGKHRFSGMKPRKLGSPKSALPQFPCMQSNH